MAKIIILSLENPGSLKINSSFFSLVLSFQIFIISHKRKLGGHFSLLPGNLLTSSNSWCWLAARTSAEAVGWNNYMGWGFLTV